MLKLRSMRGLYSLLCPTGSTCEKCVRPVARRGPDARSADEGIFMRGNFPILDIIRRQKNEKNATSTRDVNYLLGCHNHGGWAVQTLHRTDTSQPTAGLITHLDIHLVLARYGLGHHQQRRLRPSHYQFESFTIAEKHSQQASEARALVAV